MKKIETSRLVLREYSLEDKHELFRAVSDKSVMKYYPSTLDEKQTVEWIGRQLIRYKDDGYGLWAIELKETGAFIGNAGLVKQNINGKDEVEVGYLLLKQYWGNGYATEAAKACMQYAFEVLALKYLISLINPENIPSLSVSKKNGMKFRETYFKFDLTQDIYCISGTKWKKRI